MPVGCDMIPRRRFPADSAMFRRMFRVQAVVSPHPRLPPLFKRSSSDPDTQSQDNKYKYIAVHTQKNPFHIIQCSRHSMV